MQAYKDIFMLEMQEHETTLRQAQQLAADHKEYRRVVNEVAAAETQADEIDVLLKWRTFLSVDHKDGERISHDTRHTQAPVYSYAPKKQGKDYAGSLDENGESMSYMFTAYGQTMHDLYMEVLQLVAYAFYRIAPMPKRQPVVVPVSACDASDYWTYINYTGREDTDTEND